MSGIKACPTYVAGFALFNQACAHDVEIADVGAGLNAMKPSIGGICAGFRYRSTQPTDMY